MTTPITKLQEIQQFFTDNPFDVVNKDAVHKDSYPAQVIERAIAIRTNPNRLGDWQLECFERSFRGVGTGRTARRLTIPAEYLTIFATEKFK